MKSHAVGRRELSEERGQAAVLLTLVLVVLLGMAALVIDVGHAYFVHRSLQASADAAALAAAQELPDAGAAEAVGREYSGQAGSKNAFPNVPGVFARVFTECVEISPCRPVNAVTVEQTAEVDTLFAKVLGIEHFEIDVSATACSPCASRPLDIMLVLDRTGSMCQTSSGASDPSCTDLNNAKEGMRTFLRYLDPKLDHVGLAVFPPARSISRRCDSPGFDYYDHSSYPYVVVPLSDDYRTRAGALDPSSSLVGTINCVRGNGITAYANALEHAQGELDRNGRADVQDVIVFFSDGAANTGPRYYPVGSPYRKQPCHQGVWSAEAIKARGTVVYSIGYDLDASGGGANVCKAYSWDGPLESPPITAYSAIQQIASPDGFFNQPDAGELNSIYTAIAGELTGARLID